LIGIAPKRPAGRRSTYTIRAARIRSRTKITHDIPIPIIAPLDIGPSLVGAEEGSDVMVGCKLNDGAGDGTLLGVDVGDTDDVGSVET